MFRVYLSLPQGQKDQNSLYWLCLFLQYKIKTTIRAKRKRKHDSQSREKPVNAVQFSSVAQLCLTVTQSTAARQDSLSITNSRSLPKLTSIESVMPSSHLILCCPLLLLPSIFPRIRVFSDESMQTRLKVTQMLKLAHRDLKTVVKIC